MEMTTDTAGLMAQVIPTLLIVVALEPKFRGEGMEGRSALGRWMMRTGRETAAVSSLISVLLCLFVVFTDKPTWIASWFVIASTIWLVLVLVALFGVLFVADDQRSESNR